MRYLLDTNVLSEFRRPKPDANVIAWLNHVDPNTVYLSVVAVGELQKGIARLSDSARRKSLQAWLDDELLVRFQDRLVNLDLEVMLVWGRLEAELERAGKTMPAIDSLLAAAALQGGFTLVTRNEADFTASGIKTLNPWR